MLRVPIWHVTQGCSMPRGLVVCMCGSLPVIRHVAVRDRLSWMWLIKLRLTCRRV